MTLCGKGGRSRPLAATREKRPLAATRVAASGCFLWDWNTSATRRSGHLRSVAATRQSGHLRPLAATREKRPLAATRVAASGCKWLLFMRLKHLGHASKAATCGHLRPLDRAATCGHLRPLEWLRVAASGCFSEIQIPRRMQPQWDLLMNYLVEESLLKTSSHTLPETKIAPEIDGWKMKFPLGNPIFRFYC